MTTPNHEQQARDLFASYDSFRLVDIRARRFSQAEMLGRINTLNSGNLFVSTVIGKSSEGRPISILKAGGGETRVLLWSQMHGDESTATMALLDILNFLGKCSDHPIARTIRKNLTLLLIPMLNPDGAERYRRRTSQQIDMNRDALALQSPEARLLKSAQDEYRPHFGFNLHDQEPHYTVGFSRNISAIALLAPPVDERRTDDAVRTRAKHVAARLAGTMRLFIPDNLAKWDDTFEPRAFGENMQRWGTSTVLIESGGWPNDPEKMYLRKLNFVGILDALGAIADGSYAQSAVEDYESIPFNSKNGFDLIIRNVQFRPNEHGSAVRVDVGINFSDRVDAAGRREVVGTVADIGDLHTFGALEERDGRGKSLDSSLVSLDKQLTPQEISRLGS